MTSWLKWFLGVGMEDRMCALERSNELLKTQVECLTANNGNLTARVEVLEEKLEKIPNRKEEGV